MSGSSLGIAFVKTFSSHYPERLGSIQLIDPPGVFQVLLKAVGAVMDERTAAKLASVTGASHDERMALLQERIGDGPHMPWLHQVLDTPAGDELPSIPQGYYAVADTTPHADDLPASTAVSPSASPAGSPGPLPGFPAWTAGIKKPNGSTGGAVSETDTVSPPPESIQGVQEEPLPSSK